ncbi:tetratricopeptide repeat protein [Frigoriglobus tundricola]|uniref:Uncharacterized protein n=1 Tax=Frigoriglobus tundricola TaxID=2774151 RepID=A0A6M5YTW1_9BACT|nr:hypothetical protein [Frigoriglobus tundricola]QJW97319.1 hypothetical protein FTUN_4889 [Frigoriglobus tundricola]
MRVRSLCLVLATTVGCESLRPAPPVAPPAPPTVAVKPPDPPKPPVEILRASVSQPEPPAPAQPPEDDPLESVARCLERDDWRGAATHLNSYVCAHPDQPLFRLQLAELYLRGARPADARLQYERFIADAQSGPPAIRPYIVTAHIKLMEIAQRSGNRFGELFHRGVGLLLLVEEQDRAANRDEKFCEEMLCKALRALTDAKELKPGDPRVRIYLADALDRTGNRRAAAAERSAARMLLPSSEMTAAERRPMLLGE